MDEEVISRTVTLNPPSKELIGLLNRALNCMEPQKAPKWAMNITDDHQEGDEVEITIKITRKVK